MLIYAPESIKFLMASPVNIHLNTYQLIEFMNTFGQKELTLSFNLMVGI
jgi:hypothetical protein